MKTIYSILLAVIFIAPFSDNSGNFAQPDETECRILFEYFVKDCEGLCRDLALLDLQTSEIEVFKIPELEEQLFEYFVSPDEGYVAISTFPPERVTIISLDEPYTRTQVIEGGWFKQVLMFFSFIHHWSSDSNRLLLLVDENLAIYNAQTGETEILTTSPITRILNMSWSPDNNVIAFVGDSFPFVGENVPDMLRHLYILDPDSKNLQLVSLPNEDVSFFGWLSKDLITYRYSVNEQQFSMIVDLSAQVRWHLPENLFLMSKSPVVDSEFLTISRNEPSEYEIVLYELETDTLTALDLLESDFFDFFMPIWSLDGSYLAYVNHGDGSQAIIIRNMTNSQEDTIKVNALNSHLTSYVWGSWHPSRPILLFSGEVNEREILFIYDTETGTMEKTELPHWMLSVRNPQWLCK